MRGEGAVALVAMLPLLRTIKSLFPLLIAMLQCPDPKKENDIKSTTYRQVDNYVEKTGKIF